MNWRNLNLKYNFLSFQTITQVLNWRKLNLNPKNSFLSFQTNIC